MDTSVLRLDGGDTAWVLICAALVLLMTLGLIFFQAGLARKQDISNVLIAGFMTIVLVSLQWVFVGYTLAFGPDLHGTIGSLAWAGLRNVLLIPNPDFSSTVPQLAVAVYQGMIAVFTSVLILGAHVERIKFSAFILVTLLWTTLVFDPIAHWIWSSGGFLRLGGALDFAGGAVIHLNAAIAAFVASLMLGNRRRYLEPSSPPIPLPLMALGVSFLWFGSFGLIAGNALGANGLAANAFVMTQTAAAMSGLVWLMLDRFFRGQPTLSGVLLGVVSGLVAITPGAGFVGVPGAIGIGTGSALFSYFLVMWIKKYFEYDDSFDAFGIYPVSAVWGVVATGLWATRNANILGANGLFYGDPAPFFVQIKTVLTTAIYSFSMTYLIFKLLDTTMGVRYLEPKVASVTPTGPAITEEEI